MPGLHRWILLSAAFLLAAPAAADDAAPAPQLVNVWASLAIGPDGRPSQVSFPEDQELSPALTGALGPRLARAEFAPITMGGVRVGAVVPVRVALQASEADERFSVRIVEVTPMVRAVYRVQPYFPPRALQRGTGGEVKLACTIGDDGHCSSIEKVEGSRFRPFTEAATEALRRWKFEPIRVEGRSISTVVIPFHFQIGGGPAPTVHDDEIKELLAEGRIRMTRSPAGLSWAR